MRKIVHPIALLAFVTIVFAQVAEFSFLNFDDNVYVTDNPFVSNGLLGENVLWAFTHAHGGHFHPLSWLSHMLDVEIFGLWPGGHHLVNLAIHAFNTALVYWLLLRAVPRPWAALALAAAFGIHPLRIESVAWVSERKDVLALFFTLLGLHAYLYYRQRPCFARYAAVLALHALALLSKPSAVVFPALLLILDFWPLGRSFSAFKIFTEKLPFMLLSAIAAVWTLWAQQQAGALQSLSAIPLEMRLEAALVAWNTYLGKLLFPTATAIFYPFVNYAPGVAAGAAAALLLITLLCVLQRAGRPYLLAGWAWFLVSALPVIGLVPVGGQAFADRWTYLPHIGLLLALTAALSEFAGSTAATRRAQLGLLIVVASYTGITLRELPHWSTSESIFRHTLAVSPHNFMAHTNLGAALAQAERWDEAAPHYEEAYRLNPTYPEAINNVGVLRARSGRYAEAIGLFEKALVIRSDFAQARENLQLARSLSARVSSKHNPNQ